MTAENDDQRMSDPNESLPKADELLLAASALARHLSQAGVQFLPKANQDHVDQLAAEFSSGNAQSPEETSEDGARGTKASTSAAASTPDDSRGGVSNPKSAAATPSPVTPTPTNPVADMSDGQPYPLPVLSLDQRSEQLAALQSVVASCVRCPQLAQSRTQTVFGEGNPQARVAFFGEGPGADEDRSGRPFVGRAGQLLTKMIEACTFSRDDVYIFNTVKCRPPGNRNPEPAELSNCREFFENQLAIIQPEYIVCLGAVSAQTLLQTTEPVGRLRGRWHTHFASKVLVTYHPAYLLRNPAAKKAAWEDLKMMLSDMDIHV
tara:strand:- start:43908 stop:44867 length:960 start_codon:yes stop_codon:yes gene_type:complete